MCRSLPLLLRSYFVQLLAAAEPQTASPCGKKSVWTAVRFSLAGRSSTCPSGWHSSTSLGKPPWQTPLSSPCFSAIFSGCVIVSFGGSLTELSINQLNLNILCSTQTTQELIMLAIRKQIVHIRLRYLSSYGTAHQLHSMPYSHKLEGCWGISNNIFKTLF